MKIAVMQPYFMPYIGYFQLLKAVDIFVILDNVQFIRRGWIHRNRILVNSKIKMFSLPLEKSSQKTKINEKKVAFLEWEKQRRKLLTQIEQSYGHAPFFHEVYPVISKCVLYSDQNLLKFIWHSLEQLKNCFHINADLVLSSQLDYDRSLKKQERILSICKILNTETYINAIGGVDLYDPNVFERENIKLQFIKSKPIIYNQLQNDFFPFLSIIDVMMFNSNAAIQTYLNQFDIVRH